MPLSKALIVQPENGKDLFAFGEALSVLLSGEQSQEAFTVVFSLIPVGGKSLLHYQHRKDCLFLVVDGRMSYWVNEVWTEVEAGGLVYLPKGNAHAYRNEGMTPAHHWYLSTPAGMERFFDICAEEFARADGPDLQRIMASGLEQGLELFSSSATEREEKHDN
jgi:mannose-6-phosphate isomerase-like protein (cupin superfamily)